MIDEEARKLAVGIATVSLQTCFGRDDWEGVKLFAKTILNGLVDVHIGDSAHERCQAIALETTAELNAACRRENDCRQCNGAGAIVRLQTPGSELRECPDCHGSGQASDPPA